MVRARRARLLCAKRGHRSLRACVRAGFVETQIPHGPRRHVGGAVGLRDPDELGPGRTERDRRVRPLPLPLSAPSAPLLFLPHPLPPVPPPPPHPPTTR